MPFIVELHDLLQSNFQWLNLNILPIVGGKEWTLASVPRRQRSFSFVRSPLHSFLRSEYILNGNLIPHPCIGIGLEEGLGGEYLGPSWLNGLQGLILEQISDISAVIIRVRHVQKYYYEGYINRMDETGSSSIISESSIIIKVFDEKFVAEEVKFPETFQNLPRVRATVNSGTQKYQLLWSLLASP